MARTQSDQLVSYSTSVGVGGGDLSPLAKTLLLGTLIAVAGGVVYLVTRPATPQPPAAAPQPVAPTAPPAPYDPSNPGY